MMKQHYKRHSLNWRHTAKRTSVSVS